MNVVGLQNIDFFTLKCGILLQVLFVIGRAFVDQNVVFQNLLPVFSAHEKRHIIERFFAYSLGYGVFDTALLNTDVYDIRHIIWEGELGHGLDEEQRYRDYDEHSVGFKVPDQLEHQFCPLSVGLCDSSSIVLSFSSPSRMKSRSSSVAVDSALLIFWAKAMRCLLTGC